jgi:hypothetical protein
MTKGEAKAYLSYSDEHNLEDHYDEFLFKQKEFFRQKPISKKIYSSQFAKIERAIEAFEILGISAKNDSLVFIERTFSTDLKQIFNFYHSSKNQLFQCLYSTESLQNIILIGNELIRLETEYATCFNKINFSDSKPSLPDPMNVLKDINALNEIGVLFTDQLDVNKHSNFVYLFSEINRVKSIVE